MSCGESFEKEDLKVNKLWLLSNSVMWRSLMEIFMWRLFMVRMLLFL